MKKRKILSMLLAAAMVLSLLPVSALAEDKTVSTAEELNSAITSAESGDTITLGDNISAALTSFTGEKTLTFDLGGKTLTLTNTVGISIENGANITFKNGTLVSNDIEGDVNIAVFTVTNDSTVIFDKVTYNTDVTGLLVRGDAAALKVVNGSTINATGYCFGTNASTENNYNVVITLENSTFNGSDDGAGTAMYINVPGTLNIDNCKINGYFHGLFVRGGTAVIKNSTITNSVSNSNLANYFDGKSWGSGNTVNLAALTMGNKILTGNNAYDYPTNVTLVNTTITSAAANADVYPAIYAWANTNPDHGVTVSYENCTINGEVVYGNNQTNITVCDAAKIGDEYYSSLTAAITDAQSGETVTLLKDKALAETISISSDKTITLDLNGKKLSLPQVKVDGSLTICDSENGGTLTSTITTNNNSAMEVGATGLFTLESGTIKSATNNYGVYVFDGGKAIVNGGAIESDYAALTGNNTTGDMNFEVHGGTLTAKYGPAIYMPGQVSLTITGGTLNGGISLRMGQVNISGGTINAITANIDSPAEYYDFSGNAWLPDALYVFNGTYSSENTTYGNSLNLNITGGTFNCTNDQGSAVAIYDLGKVQQESKVNISGTAVLSSAAEGRDAYQVLSLNDIGVESPAEGYGTNSGKVASTITGGTFSSDPSDYVADGYVVSGSGPYTVSRYVAPSVPSTPSTPDQSETVTNPDGSVTTTVTKPDGSMTQTTQAPDGSSSVVSTGKDGQVEAQVSLSAAALSAVQAGEAVALPMPAVTAASETDSAAAVTVSLPAGVDRAVVEIPVADVTAGVVAVLVKDDGTQEIVKASVPTGEGVALQVSDGDTVKIVDNAIDFADVSDTYWGADAIDFASSRELFAGTSATTFAPEDDMTRAMIVTVLARYAGVDTSVGDTWYAAGAQWAVSMGISDGTDLDSSVTREQLVTMLYRYAGEPAVTGDTSAFTDSDDVSDWAADAMTWAIETGLIAGMGNNTLSPQGTATRAQVATILMRFITAMV